ncbi:carboxylate--amine ligase [Nocardioides caldifontis]|uniref:carboxylate--amine ligase n=1 Tax=Nocardioides caldifontis TaxID=2588938 RepID=UPI0011DFDCF9|nr:carboxylate--amine ligase [Nocardioides caldifontis]
MSGTAAPAVVIGLDCITGLQSARILAARGVPVVGVVADSRHWATRTRSCREIVTAPLSGEPLLAALRGMTRRWGTQLFLLPCTDEAVEFLSLHRERLPHGMVLPLASHDTVELLLDKVRFAEHAASAGLPVPRTTVLRDRTDAVRAAACHDFPAVLKPPMKAPGWLARTSAKAIPVHDAAELLAVYDRIEAWTPVLLVQEWVSGSETGLYSCNAYFDEGGSPLVTFVARKVRQWPPDVGTSASGEECRNDEVLDTLLKLFGGLGFHGFAYLEMKCDARTGRAVIIEPNVGRPTGRAAIAEAGGVELLDTAYRDAMGLPLPAARVQHYGDAKWVDVRRDLQAAVVARRRGTLSAGDWLRWMRGHKAHAIWSARDPLPFVADVLRATARGSRILVRSTTGGNQ